MSGIIIHSRKKPSQKLIEAFKDIPPSIASDAMNRGNAMHALIKPLSTPINLTGVALTVDTMVGDNIMSHHAIALAEPGDVIVINARGHIDTSVWGYIQTFACQQKQIAGVIIDGAVRDVREIRESKFPLFCKGSTPAGPHKGWGGSINSVIQCAGVPVAPGDIIIGDDDGIVVIPQKDAEEVLKNSIKRLKLEEEWIKSLKSGKTTVEILKLQNKISISYID